MMVKILKNNEEEYLFVWYLVNITPTLSLALTVVWLSDRKTSKPNCLMILFLKIANLTKCAMILTSLTCIFQHGEYVLAQLRYTTVQFNAIFQRKMQCSAQQYIRVHSSVPV